MLKRSDTRVTTSDMRCSRHPTVGDVVLIEDEIKLSINTLSKQRQKMYYNAQFSESHKLNVK